MRGALLAGFFASASVGSVLGVMLGGVIAARWGWQAAFGVVGVPGLVLALLYLKVRDYRTVALDAARWTPSGARSARPRAHIVKALVRSRTMLWVCIGGAAQLIVVSALWSWLPSFLNRVHGIAPDQAGDARRRWWCSPARSAAWSGARWSTAPARAAPRRKLAVMALLCLRRDGCCSASPSAPSGWASRSAPTRSSR